jgi:hypothetical protein
VKAYQVTGAKWMETEKYDIAATLPQGASAADAPEMLRNLLAGRFHLAVRRESQLGLKLETRKSPVTIIVIESADKVPVEN